MRSKAKLKPFSLHVQCVPKFIGLVPFPSFEMKRAMHAHNKNIIGYRV